jgi:hypothetical protein
MARVVGAFLGLLLMAAPAAAYRAELVPASRRAAAEDIEGVVSITEADGRVRVHLEGAATAAGDPLEGAVQVQLRLRVNGVRWRVALPLPLSAGDGDAELSLGLSAGDLVAVLDARVRGPDGRTLALAGAVLAPAETPGPPPTTPPPDDCPAALAMCGDDRDSCLLDLEDCTFDLELCESGE